MPRPLIFVLASVVAALSVLSCGGDGSDERPASIAADVTAVERQLLAEANPDTAEGQRLELTRVIIPAGENIAPHTHPGPQLAVIAAGTLTYTVIDGQVTVTRAAASDAKEVVTYSSGATFDLRVGDSIVETPGMVHNAANNGDETVVIYLSSLFPAGAPPATSVQ